MTCYIVQTRAGASAPWVLLWCGGRAADAFIAMRGAAQFVDARIVDQDGAQLAAIIGGAK